MLYVGKKSLNVLIAVSLTIYCYIYQLVLNSGCPLESLGKLKHLHLSHPLRILILCRVGPWHQDFILRAPRWLVVLYRQELRTYNINVLQYLCVTC